MSDFETPAYIQRMIEEKKDLDDKLFRIREFRLTERFYALDLGEQEMLNLQSSAMCTYACVLGERIAVCLKRERACSA